VAEKLSERRGACPSCDGTGFVQFGWIQPGDPAPRTAPLRSLAKYPSTLVLDKKLRRGWLFACPGCGQKWHLDEERRFMHVLQPTQNDLVARWNEVPQTVSSELIEVLGDIGATPPDIYGNGKDRIEIPCSVITHEGATWDPALVSLQKVPPLAIFRPEHHLVSEISSIRPSRYTLSREVRLASSKAVETRMGLSPFLAQARDGQLFMLNGTTNFFSHPGYTASDIRLPCEGQTLRPDSAIRPCTNEASFFVGDWDDHLVSLRIAAA
jgi:hypothetical protein